MTGGGVFPDGRDRTSASLSKRSGAIAAVTADVEQFAAKRVADDLCVVAARSQ